MSKRCPDCSWPYVEDNEYVRHLVKGCPEIKKPRPIHQHSYTVPVEFSYSFTDDEAAMWWVKSGRNPRFDIKRVTILRCSCGDEVRREK